MGQKTSCLGEERKSSPYTSGTTVNGRNQQHSYQPISDPTQKIATKLSDERELNGLIDNKRVRSNLIRTRTTESDHEDEDPLDRKSGYILVDLKGDKVVHIDQDYLIGCEMYAPGVGIGLIVAFVSENKFSIDYKVQMADGRNIVVAIRRCEEHELADASIANTRIFIMQRLY